MRIDSGQERCPWAAYASSAVSVFGIALDSLGYVYVSNYGGNTIQKFAPNSNSAILTIATGTGPWGLAVDPSGNIYCANYGANTLRADRNSIVRRDGLAARAVLVSEVFPNADEQQSRHSATTNAAADKGASFFVSQFGRFQAGLRAWIFRLWDTMIRDIYHVETLQHARTVGRRVIIQNVETVLVR